MTTSFASCIGCRAEVTRTDHSTGTHLKCYTLYSTRAGKEHVVIEAHFSPPEQPEETELDRAGRRRRQRAWLKEAKEAIKQGT